MMRRESKNLRMFLATVASVLLATAFASADDFAPPTWRGLEGTTFQQWTFGTDETDQILPDDGYVKPPDSVVDPVLWVDTGYNWISTSGQRQGIWPLGELDIYIPNYPNSSADTMKEILIQLTWKGAGNSNQKPDQPSIDVVPDYSGDPTAYITDKVRKDLVGQDGWVYTLFTVDVWPNPSEEWIPIKGDILVDQVIVDTYCIPEPATIMLFGTGGILMSFRRKKHAGIVPAQNEKVNS